MAKNSEKQARRKPRKRASEEIVNAIVEAASEILADSGLAKMTTNRIAERAGVSVGSVYRYFPDKETIVVEVARRERQRNGSRLLNDLEKGGSIEEALRRALRGFIGLDGSQDLKLRAVLISEVPPAWLRSVADEVWAQTESIVAQALLARIPGIGEAECKERAFIAMHAAEGAVIGASLRLPEALRPNIVEGVVNMLLAFLSRPPTPSE